MFIRTGQGRESLSQSLLSLDHSTRPQSCDSESCVRMWALWILTRTVSSRRLKSENRSHCTVLPFHLTLPFPLLPPMGTPVLSPRSRRACAPVSSPCHALPRCERGCVRLRAVKEQQALQRKQASKDLDNKNKHEAIKRRMGDAV